MDNNLTDSTDSTTSNDSDDDIIYEYYGNFSGDDYATHMEDKSARLTGIS